MSFVKKIGTKTRKFILIAVVVILFFGAQIAIIFYAKSPSVAVDKSGGDLSVLQAQVDQMNTRLQSMDLTLNYIRSYMMANR